LARVLGIQAVRARLPSRTEGYSLPNLLNLAREFCPLFEAYANAPCETVVHFGQELGIPKQLPQIVVANVETIG